MEVLQMISCGSYNGTNCCTGLSIKSNTCQFLMDDKDIDIFVKFHLYKTAPNPALALAQPYGTDYTPRRTVTITKHTP